MSSIKIPSRYNIIPVFIFFFVFLSSCSESPSGSDSDSSEEKKKAIIKEKNTNLLEIDGKVFSIPSPIQTAFLLKQVGTSYQKDLLNGTDKLSNYITTSSKAINLGIYGADLGYATIFDASDDAINYIAVTKRLSSEIGISNLFDESMLKRFEANIGNQDSLLAMVSDAFKTIDVYLKNNDQQDLSALILAGGWIETLHFATTLSASTDSQILKNRIGEQKITIKNLVNLLLPYRDDELTMAVINQLNELKDIYADINFTYTYVPSTTNAETKTTVINSESKVEMSEEQLKLIREKIASIRSSII